MTTELSPQAKMQALLDEVQVNKAKEELKQEKANTTQIKIQSELYEQASKLNSQTEAVANVQHALTAAERMHELDWADDTMKRQSVHLLKDALKRARASYK